MVAMRPDGRLAPAANRGQPTTPNETDSTDNSELSSGTAAAVLSCLMALDRQVAAEYLSALADADFPDLAHKFVLAGIRGAVNAGLDPLPLAIAEVARRLALQPPPGWRGLILTELWTLAAEPPPTAMLSWLIANLKEHAARRAVAEAGRSVADRAWLGDRADLVDLLEAHIGEMSSLLERVREK